MPDVRDTTNGFPEITVKHLPADLEQSSLNYLLDHMKRCEQAFVVLGRRKFFGKKPPLELLTLQSTLQQGKKAESNWSGICTDILTYKLVNKLSLDAPKPIITSPEQFTRLAEEIIREHRGGS